MAPSARRREDRVLEKIRRVLTAAGFDEALTLSVVDEHRFGGHQPLDRRRAAAEPDAGHPRGRCLRRSLMPSLLAARRTNEASRIPRSNCSRSPSLSAAGAELPAEE